MMGYLEVKFVIVIVVFFLGVNVNDFKVALMFMATCLRRKMFFFKYQSCFAEIMEPIPMVPEVLVI